MGLGFKLKMIPHTPPRAHGYVGGPMGGGRGIMLRVRVRVRVS